MRSALFITTIIMLAVSIGIASGAVGDGACIDDTQSQQACGVYIGSAPGYGGVELCGDCFPCGIADGVCPEDYKEDACANCPDIDCSVTITGTVRDKNTNQEVSNANVSTVMLNVPNQIWDLTDINGEYTLEEVPPGNFKIVATHKDYDKNVQDFPEGSNEVRILDFSMVEGACSLNSGEACSRNTNYGLICDTRCYGIGDCTAQSGTWPKTAGGTITYDLVKNCSDALLGPDQTIFLGNINTTHQLRGSCCSGGVGPVLRPKVSIQFDTKVTDLHQQAIPGIIKDDKGKTKGVGLLKVYLYKKQ